MANPANNTKPTWEPAIRRIVQSVNLPRKIFCQKIIVRITKAEKQMILTGLADKYSK